MPKHWTPDDIPWHKFDRSKVDPNLEKIIRAASLVEANADHYTKYLRNVFEGDEGFCQASLEWAEEEVQHGVVLARWANMVDPTFDFDDAFTRFRKGYNMETEVDASVRGSRSGELIARCMVETGTSSYYSALGDATEEPVLKVICARIAADELRHYKLFYDHLKRYISQENLTRVKRISIALGRIVETEDDELAYAFYAANAADQPYERKKYSREYTRLAYSFYQTQHLDRAVGMIFKACGLRPQTSFFRFAQKAAWFMMNSRTRQLNKIAA